MPQSLAKIYVHVIFSTKDREPVLVDGWRDELFQAYPQSTGASSGRILQRRIEKLVEAL
jgi:hypothetical protein